MYDYIREDIEKFNKESREDILIVCDVMEKMDKIRVDLFNSWWSNCFIFFPIQIYKYSVFNKEMKELDFIWQKSIDRLNKKEF